MSKFMWVAGVILLAAALALGLLLKFSPGQMQIWGLQPDAVATLLVGGILSLGLGSLIDAVSQMTGAAPRSVSTAATESTSDADALPNMSFGRRRTDAKANDSSVKETAVAVTAVATTAAASSTSVADTIAALEQAKSDIHTALGGVDRMASGSSEPAATAAEEVAEATEAAAEEGELFVVEEKIIRGRPSRVLSDDTVEAETDEGWMRFENLEHLNEYLDSLEEGEV